MNSIGTHVLADIYGVDPAILRNAVNLMNTVREALILSGYTILTENFFQFEGGGEGVTGFFLLSESHTAFHTYPEFNYVAIDVFTCGNSNPMSVINDITLQLKPCHIERKISRRGRIPNLHKFY